MEHKFKVGDKAKVIGNRSGGIIHYIPIGQEVVIKDAYDSEDWFDCKGEARLHSKGMQTIHKDDLAPIEQPVEDIIQHVKKLPYDAIALKGLNREMEISRNAAMFLQGLLSNRETGNAKYYSEIAFDYAITLSDKLDEQFKK